MQFNELQLITPLLRAVQQEGYEEPTPIQAQAIPHILAGKDMIGLAQTGTGKTAAFALPILQRLANTQPRQRGAIRALVLSPTRELAAQIGDSFSTYGRHIALKNTVIFGGVGQQPQANALRRGVDILVATPGRLLDLITQRIVMLNAVEIFVLDEADRMLDMGFINDVRKVIALLPKQRQTLLFSATMPEAIQELADSILISPVTVAVTPPATTVETITQSVFFVEKRDKRALLEHLLNEDKSIRRVLVFTRTKHGANKLVEQLVHGGINADAIHSNKSQTAREKALANFKNGKTRVLVATDIASRGIDVDDVTHIVNYDLPYEPESYVHRIGRTARAGASGVAFAFCDSEERKLLRDIERLIRMSIPVQTHPFLTSASTKAQNTTLREQQPRQQQRTSNSNASRQQDNSRREQNAPRRENGQTEQSKAAAPRRENGQNARNQQNKAAAPRPEPQKRSAQPAEPRMDRQEHTNDTPTTWNANPYSRLTGSYSRPKYASYEALVAAEASTPKEQPAAEEKRQPDQPTNGNGSGNGNGSENNSRRSRKPRRRYDRETV